VRNQVDLTTGGLPMMTGEATVVPQCRVRLAPTASLMSRLVVSGGDGLRRWLVPWVAIIGHLRPVVMTACNCRRIAARTPAVRVESLVRKWVVSGQAKHPGGAQRSRDGFSGEVEYLLSGGGLQSDFVAEGFEFADVVALPTFWVDA
jgi:hypothetical protein